MKQPPASNARYRQYARQIPQVDTAKSEPNEGVMLAALAFLVLAAAVFFLSGAWGGPNVFPTVLGATKVISVNLVR